MLTRRWLARAAVLGAGLAAPLAGGCAGEAGPAAPAGPVERPTEYASPFQGSGGFGYHHGSSFVGAAAPHGLAKVAPDTSGPFGTIRFIHFSGYWYGDDIVQGFSHMHLHGTGAPDYGVLSLMPTDGFDAARRTPAGYQSKMDKGSEVASPGYYAVTLLRGGVRVELTATTHAAHHRYRFAPGAERWVVLDLGKHLEGGSVRDGELRIDGDRRRLTGRLRTVGAMSGGFGGADLFFVLKSAAPFAAQQVFAAGREPAAGDAISGTDVGAALRFPPGEDAVELQVGLSLVSIEGAERNLAAEMPAFAFDAERKATEDAWQALLRSVVISGGSEDERRTFYSSLYHVFLMPTVQSDVDGAFRGHDGAVRRAEGWRFLSDLSLWDTYRTTHPLYALVAPETARDAVRSLHQMAKDKGFFPKWPLSGGDSGSMIGAPAELVVADAYLRGVRDFDAEGAYGVLRAAALGEEEPAGGRGGRGRGGAQYQRLAYVPAGDGSVSLTTEYGRGDDALARLAAALGKGDDAARLRARSLGYRKLYDPQVGFLRPRRADGTFLDGAFDPLCFCADFVEANAWHSLWMDSYDAQGMMELLGGPGPFVSKLGELFDKGKEDYELTDPKTPIAGAGPRAYYWHGNEVDIHAPYLFAEAGRPDLTQRWVRWIMANLYSAAPDGLTGNDDGGTLTGWYVLSALGLYPQPGSDEWILGVPLFPRAEVRLPGGGMLTVVAEGLSPEHAYVRAVELDGKPVTGPKLRHGDLRPGSTLTFFMTGAPGAP